MLRSILKHKVSDDWYKIDPVRHREYHLVTRIFQVLILIFSILNVLSLLETTLEEHAVLLRFCIIPIAFWILPFLFIWRDRRVLPLRMKLLLVVSLFLSAGVWISYQQYMGGKHAQLASVLLSILLVVVNVYLIYLANDCCWLSLKRISSTLDQVIYKIMFGVIVGGFIGLHFIYVINNFIGYSLTKLIQPDTCVFLSVYIAGMVVISRELFLRGVIFSLLQKYLNRKQWVVILQVVILDIILHLSYFSMTDFSLRKLIALVYIAVTTVIVTLFRSYHNSIYPGVGVQVMTFWIFVAVLNLY